LLLETQIAYELKDVELAEQTLGVYSAIGSALSGNKKMIEKLLEPLTHDNP